MYPRTRPYKKGYLDVGDGHKIYYECVGNPKGRPVLFIHGGPGLGISPQNRTYFNPKKFNVILFDQRGSGKSKPFASIKHNTTQKLVQDMDKLLDFLDIKKVILFGGSWGSTLALVYAIHAPKRVRAMVIRGIFLLTKEEDEFYVSEDKALFFPEVWERFISHVPEKYRKDPMAYYLKQMAKDGKKADKYAYEFARYELSIAGLNVTKKQLKKWLSDDTYKSLGKLEVHYLVNDCFLPQNFILKNIRKIRHIPTSIVHGRYDMICPPVSAWHLHKSLPKSRLCFTISGHSSQDGGMKQKLKEEMDKLA